MHLLLFSASTAARRRSVHGRGPWLCTNRVAESRHGRTAACEVHPTSVIIGPYPVNSRLQILIYTVKQLSTHYSKQASTVLHRDRKQVSGASQPAF
eukprot:459625-Prymnesium_polylepis.1